MDRDFALLVDEQIALAQQVLDDFRGDLVVLDFFLQHVDLLLQLVELVQLGLCLSLLFLCLELLLLDLCGGPTALCAHLQQIGTDTLLDYMDKKRLDLCVLAC